MKIYKIVFLFFSFGMLISVSNAQNKQVNDVKFINAIIKKDWNGANALLAPIVKSQIEKVGLKSIFEDVQAKLGTLSSFNETPISNGTNKNILYFAVHFTTSDLTIQIASNDSAQIIGFYLVPMIKLYQEPKYLDKSKIQTTSVSINSGNIRLPAVVTTPRDSFPKNIPVAILVSGSGPCDMDETIEAEKPFKDLSIGLAENGVASIRFDKRQFIYHDSLKTFTINAEYLTDIKSAITLAKKLKGIDTTQIFIIGHSLGGMLSPLLLKENPTLAGAIMLEANARPVEDLIYEQSVHLSKSDTSTLTLEKVKEIKSQVQQVKLITLKDSNKFFFGAYGTYWYSLNKYHPIPVAQKLKNQRLLIIQGGDDYQVTMTDFTLWKNALNTRSNVSFKFYKNINHALIEGSGSLSPSEYDIPGNVPLYLIKDISDWINSRKQ